MTARTWIVLGASSPIAKAFAHTVAERGHEVILAGRDLEDLVKSARDISIRHGVEAEALAFDALEPDGHDGFVEACRQVGGGRLSVFLAVGDMPDQEAIDRDVGLGLRCMAASYMGVVSVLHRLAPLLEAQGEGQVVVLGSVAGDRGRIKNYVYGSAKAGLHAYLQGLRARLFRAGVSVTTVKPGFIDTAMTWGLPGTFLVASPEACARACLRWAETGAESRYFPGFWWGIMTIIRAIPEPIFKRLSI